MHVRKRTAFKTTLARVISLRCDDFFIYSPFKNRTSQLHYLWFNTLFSFIWSEYYIFIQPLMGFQIFTGIMNITLQYYYDFLMNSVKILFSYQILRKDAMHFRRNVTYKVVDSYSDIVCVFNGFWHEIGTIFLSWMTDCYVYVNM